ncbi:MAG: hypothetical protein QOG44_3431 [Acidimicrobiaceae bacterium]|nr:hypothetical protein [Acidimicrobiaceae bacterium]
MSAASEAGVVLQVTIPLTDRPSRRVARCSSRALLPIPPPVLTARGHRTRLAPAVRHGDPALEKGVGGLCWVLRRPLEMTAGSSWRPRDWTGRHNVRFSFGTSWHAGRR